MNKKARYRPLLIFIVLLTYLEFLGSAQSGFIQNKGQWNDAVLFKKTTPGAIIYLKENGISVLQYDNKQWSEVVKHGSHKDHLEKFKSGIHKVKAHHYEVIFKGGKAEDIKPEDPEKYKLNYLLGNDKNSWASNVQDFQKVRYQNVYPHIDILFKSYYFSYKYDIIVKHGGKMSNVQLLYKHLNSMGLTNDNLILKTNAGKIKEEIPKSFAILNNDTTEIKVNLELANNIVTFNADEPLENWNEVIIDPEVVFSTYAGNSVDNFGFTATYDTSGNLYSGGISTSPDFLFNAFGRYPTTLGAFDMTFNGGTEDFSDYGFPCDISISKYSSDGSTLVYATLIGGNRNEYPHSIVCDEQQNLIIYGTSFSADYPTTSNALQSSRSGQQDIILTKLNATGTGLINSTYFGGSGRDGLNEANLLKFFLCR